VAKKLALSFTLLLPKADSGFPTLPQYILWLCLMAYPKHPDFASNRHESACRDLNSSIGESCRCLHCCWPNALVDKAKN